MVINTNTTSMFAQRALEQSSQGLSKSLSRLSSGSRIVSPEDDAAGLAVSMKFRAEMKRIGGAQANVGNAASFSQTQEGFLNTINTALRRMSELATLAADGTKSADDVGNYNKEFQELKAFVNSSAAKTFNSVSLFSVDTWTTPASRLQTLLVSKRPLRSRPHTTPSWRRLRPSRQRPPSRPLPPRWRQTSWPWRTCTRRSPRASRRRRLTLPLRAANDGH